MWRHHHPPWRLLKGTSLSLVLLLCGLGCTLESSDRPERPTQQLRTLADCITQSQQTLDATTGPEISGADLAPANSTLADAQDASEAGKKLIDQGQEREAVALLSKALGDCHKIAGMAAQVRQDASTRTSRMRDTVQVETRMMQIMPCMDTMRQTLRGPGSSKKRPDYDPADAALAEAEQAMRDARTHLSQGDSSGARTLLDLADADCRLAQDIVEQAGPLQPAATSRRRSR